MAKNSRYIVRILATIALLIGAIVPETTGTVYGTIVRARSLCNTFGGCGVARSLGIDTSRPNFMGANPANGWQAQSQQMLGRIAALNPMMMNANPQQIPESLMASLTRVGRSVSLSSAITDIHSVEDRDLQRSHARDARRQ